MKCWKCGNELTTGDKPNSAMCRDCEFKEAADSSDWWNPGLGKGTPTQWRSYLHRNKQYFPVGADLAFQIIDAWEEEVERLKIEVERLKIRVMLI